jgi:hypothetical protein
MSELKSRVDLQLEGDRIFLQLQGAMIELGRRRRRALRVVRLVTLMGVLLLSAGLLSWLSRARYTRPRYTRMLSNPLVPLRETQAVEAAFSLLLAVAWHAWMHRAHVEHPPLPARVEP